ncbi:hypothetical protein OPV22_032573 [Ensete ventricosum]|uniref:Secreted protein n=1 Tax=Ensete ventricosum TaxID=4639 RepID=A0AAV8PN47_ENSVE|nr:hypothetical protein OPV22_032573 [Ensete ventricosum]
MFLLPKHTNLCLPIIALIVGPVDPAHLHLVCTLYTSNDSYSSLSILGAWRSFPSLIQPTLPPLLPQASLAFRPLNLAGADRSRHRLIYKQIVILSFVQAPQ